MAAEVDMVPVVDDPSWKRTWQHRHTNTIVRRRQSISAIHTGRHTTTTSAQRTEQKEVVCEPERVLHLRLRRGGLAQHICLQGLFR